MLFTQEQIEEIRERLSISGSKDTKLPLVLLPLSGEETIALVQQGENKRVPIENFYEEFARYIDNSERVDLFNVSRYVSQQSEVPTAGILTLDEAIAACPNDVRRRGQLITFETPNHEWALWQFQGDDVANWSDTNLWHCYEGTDGKFWIVDITSSGIATDKLGRKWQFSPYVENYITITPNWIYDGLEHSVATTNTAFTIYWADSQEGLIDSDITTVPIVKNAGSHTWYWKAVSNRQTVSTGNFTIVVSKREVTFTSGSASKKYDGTPLINDSSVLVDGALSIEPFFATAVGSITNYGETPNTIDIEYPEGYLASNYTLQKTEGTLRILSADNRITWVTSPTSTVILGNTIEISAEAEHGNVVYYFGDTSNETGTFTPDTVGEIEVYAKAVDPTHNYADVETAKVTVIVTSVTVPMYWGKMNVSYLNSTYINDGTLTTALANENMHTIDVPAEGLAVNVPEEDLLEGWSLVVLVPQGHRGLIHDGISTIGGYIPFDSTYGVNGTVTTTINGLTYYIYGEFVLSSGAYKLKIE